MYRVEEFVNGSMYEVYISESKAECTDYINSTCRGYVEDMMIAGTMDYKQYDEELLNQLKQFNIIGG